MLVGNAKDLDEEGVSEEIDRRWGELSEEKKEVRWAMGGCAVFEFRAYTLVRRSTATAAPRPSPTRLVSLCAVISRRKLTRASC